MSQPITHNGRGIVYWVVRVIGNRVCVAWYAVSRLFCVHVLCSARSILLQSWPPKTTTPISRPHHWAWRACPRTTVTRKKRTVLKITSADVSLLRPLHVAVPMTTRLPTACAASARLHTRSKKRDPKILDGGFFRVPRSAATQPPVPFGSYRVALHSDPSNWHRPTSHVTAVPGPK